MTFIVVVLILIIIFIISDKNLDKIEGYDARFTNMTIDNCANFCKTRAGCFGFAFDPKNLVCYPSKSILSNLPSQSLFIDEKKKSNITCNKFNPIIKAIKNPPYSERKSNALYSCKGGSGLQPQYYLDNKKLNRIDEGQNLDYIPNVTNYNVVYFKWPNSKYNADQLDLLRKDREKQFYTSKTVTQINRIRNQQEESLQKMKEANQGGPLPTYISPEEKLKMKKQERIDLGTIKGMHKIPIYKKKSNVDSYNRFKIYGKYNDGKYLKDYKCIQKIPLKGCLRYCLENNKCVGVEWNPVFFEHENVCCPYKDMGNLVYRRNIYKHGNYYMKKQNQNSDKSKISMYY